MLKKIKDEVGYYNTYEGGMGGIIVAVKTIGRLLFMPVMMFVKLYEWVYYNDVSDKLDEIHEKVRYGRW